MRPDPTPSDGELDYLLAAGRLSGDQREAIFAAAAASAGRRGRGPRALPAWKRRRFAVAGVAALATAACFGLWARGPLDHDLFRSKGSRSGSAVTVDVECLHGSLGACPRGAVLAFTTGGVSGAAFVTSYLEPIAGGARVWLLSNEPIAGQAAGGGNLLGHGARVPQGQAPGPYAIEVLVTRRPLSREQAIESQPPGVLGRARFEAGVSP